MEEVGILGGTFNPVHIGHLLVAQTVREHCGLDRIVLMPCSAPPHKTPERLASAEDRLAMVRLAIEGDAGLEAGTLEVERGGVSYAVDTLRAFRARFPASRPHFIVGMDAVRELHLWRQVGELLTLCAFIVVHRPGTPSLARPDEIPLPPPWPARLLANTVEGRLCEVSSSEIRGRVADGLPIRYLVPPAVERYIGERRLYLPESDRPLPAAQGDRH